MVAVELESETETSSRHKGFERLAGLAGWVAEQKRRRTSEPVRGIPAEQEPVHIAQIDCTGSSPASFAEPLLAARSPEATAVSLVAAAPQVAALALALELANFQ